MLLLKPKNYQNVNRWRDSFHHATHTQPICKVKFAKIRNFVFFLISIRFISQKCIIFAADLKNDTKLQQIFNINKLNYIIMKKIICSLVCFGDEVHLHIGYEPIILPTNGKLVTSFSVSDVFVHFDSNHDLPKELI